MQGVVDFRGVFMDVCIGWPGKVHDACVFSNLDIYKKGIQGSLLINTIKLIISTSIGVLSYWWVIIRWHFIWK